MTKYNFRGKGSSHKKHPSSKERPFSQLFTVFTDVGGDRCDLANTTEGPSLVFGLGQDPSGKPFELFVCIDSMKIFESPKHFAEQLANARASTSFSIDAMCRHASDKKGDIEEYFKAAEDASLLADGLTQNALCTLSKHDNWGSVLDEVYHIAFPDPNIGLEMPLFSASTVTIFLASLHFAGCEITGDNNSGYKASITSPYAESFEFDIRPEHLSNPAKAIDLALKGGGKLHLLGEDEPLNDENARIVDLATSESPYVPSARYLFHKLNRVKELFPEDIYQSVSQVYRF